MMSDNQVKLIELEIGQLEEQRRGLEKKKDELSKRYTIAAIGFFLGLIIMILALRFWYCGGILMVAGAASAITQTVKKRRLQNAIDDITDTIADQRDRLKVQLSG